MVGVKLFCLVYASLEVFAAPTIDVNTKPCHKQHEPSTNNHQELNNSLVYVDTEMPINTVEESFISCSLSPSLLLELPWADSKTINLAQELSPAWFKIAPSRDNPAALNMSLYQWAAVNHFTSEAGFKQMWDSHYFSASVKIWESQGFVDDYSPIHAMSIPTVHEFPPAPKNIGFSVRANGMMEFEQIIKVLPRYNTPDVTVTGPENYFFANAADVDEFQTWLKNNSDRISSISWQPSRIISEKNEISTEQSDVFKLEQTFVGNIVNNLGMAKKDLWIGDVSIDYERAIKLDKFVKSFNETLVWFDRVCTAAANGVSLVFQPNLLPLHQNGVLETPSPLYWTAVLFKRLAGVNVLSVTSRCEGSASCRLYSHCTQNHHKSPYQDGAVTLIGINMHHTELRGAISQAASGSSNQLHEYVLTSNSESQNVFLNGELLKVDTETGKLPPLQPKRYKNPEILLMPAKSIVFWVFPNVRAGACTINRRGKRLSPDTTHLALLFPVEDILGPNDKQKRCPNMKQNGLEQRSKWRKLLARENEECPPGCTPLTERPCECKGIGIVAPGCSTTDLLQRLLNLAKMRRNKCCCCDKTDPTHICDPDGESRINVFDDGQTLFEGEAITSDDTKTVNRFLSTPPPASVQNVEELKDITEHRDQDSESQLATNEFPTAAKFIGEQAENMVTISKQFVTVAGPYPETSTDDDSYIVEIDDGENDGTNPSKLEESSSYYPRILVTTGYATVLHETNTPSPIITHLSDSGEDTSSVTNADDAEHQPTSYQNHNRLRTGNGGEFTDSETSNTQIFPNIHDGYTVSVKVIYDNVTTPLPLYNEETTTRNVSGYTEQGKIITINRRTDVKIRSRSDGAVTVPDDVDQTQNSLSEIQSNPTVPPFTDNSPQSPNISSSEKNVIYGENFTHTNFTVRDAGQEVETLKNQDNKISEFDIDRVTTEFSTTQRIQQENFHELTDTQSSFSIVNAQPSTPYFRTTFTEAPYASQNAQSITTGTEIQATSNLATAAPNSEANSALDTSVTSYLSASQDANTAEIRSNFTNDDPLNAVRLSQEKLENNNLIYEQNNQKCKCIYDLNSLHRFPQKKLENFNTGDDMKYSIIRNELNRMHNSKYPYLNRYGSQFMYSKPTVTYSKSYKENIEQYLKERSVVTYPNVLKLLHKCGYRYENEINTDVPATIEPSLLQPAERYNDPAYSREYYNSNGFRYKPANSPAYHHQTRYSNSMEQYFPSWSPNTRPHNEMLPHEMVYNERGSILQNREEALHHQNNLLKSKILNGRQKFNSSEGELQGKGVESDLKAVNKPLPEHTSQQDRNANLRFVGKQYDEGDVSQSRERVPLEDCMVRCMATKFCSERNFNAGLSKLMQEFVSRQDMSVPQDAANTQDDANEFLRHAFMYRRGPGDGGPSDSKETVYVDCPANCSLTPCIDTFYRKLQILTSVMSWLKDCFNNRR